MPRTAAEAHDRPEMNPSVKDAIAVVAYIAAILGALGFFFFSLATLLVGGQSRHAARSARMAVAVIGLVVAIGGGYLWFRFLSVG